MITDTQIDKLGRKRPELYAKTQEAMNLVINHGVDEKTAYTLTKGHPPTDSSLSRFRDKVQKFSLKAPRLVKKAYKGLEDMIDMKPIKYQVSKPISGIGVVDYEETIIPSFTNRLGAIAMVFDRDQPVKNINVNLNATAQIDPVDMTRYLG